MTQVLPDHKQTRPDLPPSSPTRRRRSVVLFTVIALLLGALGGFLAGRATAPEETVTNTVVKTVTAPAYTTSSTVAATVVFDGAKAAYSGPAEMKAGTVAKFTLQSKDAVLAVGRVAETVTWEMATAYTSTTQPPWMMNDIAVSEPGNASITVSMTEGLYLVTALTSPASTDRAYHATMIRVTK